MGALPPEARLASPMALRKFTDRSGCVWNVWSVHPAKSAHTVQEPLREVPSPERETEDEARTRVSGELSVIGTDD